MYNLGKSQECDENEKEVEEEGKSKIIQRKIMIKKSGQKAEEDKEMKKRRI